MRVRTKGYYNLTKKEFFELLEHCRKSNFDQYELLKESAEEVNSSISIFILESILQKLSYEKISTRNIIPCSEYDFYRYRILVIVKFKEKLNENR